MENIKIIAEAGAAWVRHDVFEWDKIEPARQDPPAYNWSAVDDQALQNARQAGLNVIGVVKYAPDWAQKDPGVACGPIAEAALERFGQFMYETVRRYSQPPYEIKYWELGNEIDVESDVVPPHNPFGCWGDREDPFYGGGYYAEMLKAVYPQIKLADPEAQVLVGALLLDCDPNNPPKGKDCKSARFMEGILFNGGGPFLDGISFHGYDYYMRDHFGNGNWTSEDAPNGPVFVGKIEFLNNLLGQYKVPEKYLMLTEVAMLCGSIGTEPQCSTPLYAQVKRTFIIQTLVYSRANNLRAQIWYSLEGWRASGLKQGRALEESAYSAFRFFANFIADARWEGRQDLYPGVMLMEFSKQGKTYWVLWSEDYSSQVTVNLPKSPTVIYNSLGEEQPLSTTLGLSFEPIIVGWDD